jgi:hypothetical protein
MIKSPFLLIFVISLCYFPAFVPNTSIRIDYLISIFSVFLILPKKDYLFKLKRPLLIYSSFFTLANIFQLFFYQTQTLLVLVNSMGFFRTIGVFNFLSSYKYKLYTVKKILFSTVYIYPILGIIDYVNLEPINSLINLFYRFSCDNQMLGRATGIFQRVHGLAYFNVLAIIILLTDKKFKKSSLMSHILIFLNLVSLFLTFSRSGLIFLFVVVFILYRKFFYIYLLILITGLILIFNFFEGSKLYNIIDSIYNGYKYFIGDPNFDERGAAFITARLEWGWGNSFNKFLDSPVIGNLNKTIGDFVGDGGYVEILANQGLFGLIGFILFISWFLFNKIKTLRYIGFSLLLLNIGASCFTERLLDLLILYVILSLQFINEKKSLSLN